MIRCVVCAVVILFSVNVYSQDSSVFINTLGEKQSTTFEDAVTLFTLAINRIPRGFVQDRAYLKENGILQGMEYEARRPLRRGILARMVARQLHLRGSLMYLIFGTERYAYTACIEGGIMDPDESEWDVLSGEELIEVISRMSERVEGGR